MIRPFVWTLCFLISGIIVGQSASKVCFALFGIIVVLICILIGCCYKSKFPIIYFFFFILGNILITIQLQPSSKVLDTLAEQKQSVVVEGTVINVSYTTSKRQKITVQTNCITWEKGKETDDFKILAVLEKYETVSIWDTVKLEGEILSLEKNTTEGGYDERLYLGTRGYDYKIYPDKTTVTGQNKTPILSHIYQLKESVKTVYDTVLPQEKSSILKAMVTGDKDDIDAITKQRYTTAGITHILAISGLHVSIISMYLFYALEKLLLWNKRKSFIILFFCLVFYLFFAGFSPSSVRAVIMISVGLIGNLIYYEGDSLNNVAIAAICILLIQPLYLWDIGFQLSFITITGILLGANMLKNNPLPTYIKNSFGICIIASAVSFPITAYHFYSISLIGILVNIVVLPLTGILLAMGMIVGIIGLVSIPIATFFSGTVYYILDFYEKICILAESVPYGYVLWGQPSVIIVVLCYILFLAVYFYNRNKVYCKYIIISLEMILLCIIFGNKYFFQKDKITFLDVGQGDSTIIQTYDGYTYVVDTGGTFQTPLGRNTGTYDVLPYLQKEGISKIDGLFITHMDKDHCLGAIELFDQIEIGGIYISNYAFEKTPLSETFFKNANKYHIPIYTIETRENAQLGQNMFLEVIYPYEKMIFFDADDNHGSLVLHITSGNTSFLLTGDAGAIDEKIILDHQSDDIKSTILKVGHHGSKYSTTKSFLEAIQPEIAILSYGKDNVYGHPHTETIQRLQEQNIILYETAKQGTITILIGKDGYTIEGTIQE